MFSLGIFFVGSGSFISILLIFGVRPVKFGANVP